MTCRFDMKYLLTVDLHLWSLQCNDLILRQSTVLLEVKCYMRDSDKHCRKITNLNDMANWVRGIC